MTSFEALIRHRRSIRAYRPEAPPEEDLEAMLLCATQTPSPSNTQPVHFMRLRSPGARERLRLAMMQGYHDLLQSVAAQGQAKRLRNWIKSYWRFSEFMFQAPVLLAAGTIHPVPGFTEELRRVNLLSGYCHQERDAVLSLGLALMAVMLKAEELGLGSCILTAPLVFG